VILELLQMVVPDRDARVIDVLEKLTGGAAGILGAGAFLTLIRSQQSARPRTAR
jgi:hypothetical protein